MKVGLTLPQFRSGSEPALETAARAEAVGLDGVFVFDHLWPLGRPDRPALHGLTLVAALLAATDRVTVGTLVARVGLLPDAVLANTFASLHRMAGDRLVAGVGVGDAMSRPENVAIGVAFRPRPERLANLVAVCRRLRARGITTWVGGNAPSTRALGWAEADAVNVWGVAPDALAADMAEARSLVDRLNDVPPGTARHRDALAFTWAGQVDLATLGPTGVAGQLRAVAATGATWAVVAPINADWTNAVETVAAAKRSLVD